MLKKVSAKWTLLFGSTLATLWLGQCIADLVEDAIVFSWVN